MAPSSRDSSGIRGAPPVEVGADRDDHAAALELAGVPQELVDERAALALVRAGREELLELVDDEHRRGVALSSARRSSRSG